MVDHSSMRLGKTAAVSAPHVLKLSNYRLTPPSPANNPPPPSVDWCSEVTYWPMDGNDTVCDCTTAAAAHAVQALTQYGCGTQAVISQADVLAAYSAVSGYNGTPATDVGASLVAVLQYWQNTGIGGHKIKAFATVNPANQAEVQEAIATFGGLYVGVELPISAQTQDPWAQGDVNGGTGSTAAGSWGGHCVPLQKYDSSYATCVTWGSLKQMTWGWFAQYCSEAYVVITEDFLNASGVNPQGYNLTQLLADAEVTMQIAAGATVTGYEPWLGVATVNGGSGVLIGRDTVLTHVGNLLPTLSDNVVTIGGATYTITQAFADCALGGTPATPTRGLAVCLLNTQVPAGNGYFGIAGSLPTVNSNAVISYMVPGGMAQAVGTELASGAGYTFTSPELMYFSTAYLPYWAATGSGIWAPSVDGAYASLEAVYCGRNDAIGITAAIYNQVEYFLAKAGRSATIDRLFHAVLGKTNMYDNVGDIGGWAYWSAAFATAAQTLLVGTVYPPPSAVLSGPALYIAQSFLNCTPFNATDSATANTFVLQLYATLFGQTSPNPAGVAYWVGQITSGAVSPVLVLVTFVCHPTAVTYSGSWAAQA